MRLIPLIIAALVSAFMFFFVIERERLLAFAVGGDDSDAPSVATEAGTEVAEVEEDTDSPALDIVHVQALHSTARLIDSAVVVRGVTEADRQVDVMAETSGLVISDPLRKGAFVEAGQVLCEIDPGTRGASLAEAQARLAEARANVPTAQARVEQAKASLDEAMINDNAASKLSQEGFASETRVAATQAAVRAAEAGVASAISGLESAQAAIQSAEAAVASAQKEIERLTVTAPFAGLLETDTAEIGSLLQASGPNGAHCATIIELDPIILVGFVPETEVARVEIGAMAGARLTDGSQVRGRVTFISRSADETTRTFRVEIQVDNKDLRIRDGQTAEIVIAAEGKKAHLLPQSALTLNDEGKLGVRTVTTDKRTEFNPVVVLRDTAEGIWLAGLPEEANVIIVGQEYVVAGVQVEASYQEHNE
jgi:multidrug efflux system membrane fusion protein